MLAAGGRQPLITSRGKPAVVHVQDNAAVGTSICPLLDEHLRPVTRGVVDNHDLVVRVRSQRVQAGETLFRQLDVVIGNYDHADGRALDGVYLLAQDLSTCYQIRAAQEAFFERHDYGAVVSETREAIIPLYTSTWLGMTSANGNQKGCCTRFTVRNPPVHSSTRPGLRGSARKRRSVQPWR